MQHILKIWPAFFHSIVVGEKTDQLRRDDRNFQKGDTLLLREFDPSQNIYLGKVCEVIVTDVQRDFEGLVPGYCILSIKLSAKACRWVPEMVGKPVAEVEAMDVAAEEFERKRLVINANWEKEQAKLKTGGGRCQRKRRKKSQIR